MKVIKGDLIKMAVAGEFDVIVHGCNCFCKMGAGIAKQVKEVFPEAYEADMQTQKGGKSKLGHFSYAEIKRDNFDVTVISAYTQYKYWGAELLVDYEAIYNVFTEVRSSFAGKRIGIPMIGAGLAGGDWVTIENIISEIMYFEDITVVEFE